MKLCLRGLLWMRNHERIYGIGKEFLFCRNLPTEWQDAVTPNFLDIEAGFHTEKNLINWHSWWVLPRQPIGRRCCCLGGGAWMRSTGGWGRVPGARREGLRRLPLRWWGRIRLRRRRRKSQGGTLRWFCVRRPAGWGGRRWARCPGSRSSRTCCSRTDPGLARTCWKPYYKVIWAWNRNFCCSLGW